MTEIIKPGPEEVEHDGGRYTKLIAAMKVENANLRAELGETKEQVERGRRLLEELERFSLTAEPGQIMMETKGEIVKILAFTLGEMIGDAPNFITMVARHPTAGKLELTVRRETGETPGEQLVRLRAELEEQHRQWDAFRGNAYTAAVGVTEFELKRCASPEELQDLVQLRAKVATISLLNAIERAKLKT